MLVNNLQLIQSFLNNSTPFIDYCDDENYSINHTYLFNEDFKNLPSIYAIIYPNNEFSRDRISTVSFRDSNEYIIQFDKVYSASIEQDYSLSEILTNHISNIESIMEDMELEKWLYSWKIESGYPLLRTLQTEDEELVSILTCNVIVKLSSS